MAASENLIYFVDVTNRDGVQTSRLGLAKLQKTIINLMLDDMGITQSEFGFPTTRHELNYLNGNLQLVDRGVITKTKLSGWMRGIAKDVFESFQNVPRLTYCNLSQSTSDQMINGKFQGKKTRDDVLKMTCEAVEAAVTCGARIIGVNAEDASRSDLDFLIKFAKEVKPAAQNASDTVIRWVMTTRTPLMKEFTNSQKKQGSISKCIFTTTSEWRQDARFWEQKRRLMRALMHILTRQSTEWANAQAMPT